MAGINPRTILKHLDKTKGVYQTTAPNSKDKPEVDFIKVEKGLKALQLLATKQKNESNKQDFESKKSETVKFFRAYNTDLKGFKSKDPNAPRLPAYQKALAKLLKGLLDLDFATLDDAEQTLDLGRLPEVDASVLEEAPTDTPPTTQDDPGIGRSRSGATVTPPQTTTGGPPKTSPPPVPQRPQTGPPKNPPPPVPQTTGGPPKSPPPKPPSPTPTSLKIQEEAIREGAEQTQTQLTSTLKEIEALTGRADRRRKLAERDGKIDDDTWIQGQTKLELKLVTLKRAAKKFEEDLAAKNLQADKLRQERAQMLDNRIHGAVPQPTAQRLQSIEGEISKAQTESKDAQGRAEKANAELTAVHLPAITEKKLKDAERRVRNLKQLIKDEKGRVILPGTAKSKRRDEAVSTYEKDLLEAEQAVLAAKKTHDEAVLKAAHIVGTESKLRVKDADSRMDAADAEIALRTREAELAAERAKATIKQREALQANFDKALLSMPKGAELLQSASKAEGDVNARQSDLALATEKYNLLTNIASGMMVEPALKDAQDIVAEKEAEQARLAAAVKKEAAYLKEAQDANLPQDKIDAFQKAFDEAENARQKQEAELGAAKSDVALAEKLSRGDARAIEGAKKVRDKASNDVKRLEQVLKQAQARTNAPDQLKPFEDALAAAQLLLAKQERLVAAGERGAAILATGVPAKVAERAKEEKRRDDAQKALDDDQKIVADILAGGKLDGKLEKDDKKKIKAAGDELAKKQINVATANEVISSLNDQIADAGPNVPKELKEKLEHAKQLLKACKQQESEAVKAFDKANAEAYGKAEKKLSKEDQAALLKARNNIAVNKDTLKDAKTKLKVLNKEIGDLTDQIAATEKQTLESAKQALEEADKKAQEVNAEFDDALKNNPTAKEALAALEQVDETLARDREKEVEALTAVAAAEAEAIIAGFQKEALENVTVEKKAFEFFKDVSAEDFEEAIRKGVNSSKIGKMFPALPVAKGRMSPTEKAEFDKEYQRVLKVRAEYTEYLRQAQEAMDRLVERDQILDEAGASFEDRKAAMAHVPEQFLPPKFKEELKAYREVNALFQEEDEEERIKQANKAQAKETILSALGDLAAVARPIVDIFLDAMDVAGNLTGFDSNSQNPSFLASIQDQTGNFSIASSIAGGISALLSDKDMFAEEVETIDGVMSPEDNEEAQRRKLVDEDKAVKILSFLKEFVMAQAKTAYSALNIATNVTNTSLQAVPILNTVISGIEAGIEIGKAGQVITRASREALLLHRTRADNEDEALASSMRNQVGRSANRATKQSIHAVSKTTYAVGTGLMVGGGGYGSAVGAVMTGAGKGLEYGNKAAFQVIDWGMAHKAEKTLELARAGSQVAMQEIFKDHQKYATMYICLKAKRGDARALKFCQIRGLDRQAVLDSATSLKLIRQEMLKVVEQTDHMNTFSEDAAETWDKIARAGKLLASGVNFVTGGGAGKVVDKISEGAKALKDRISPPDPIPTIAELMDRPTPQHFMQLLLRGQALAAKVQGGEDITEKDAADRNRIVIQMQTLQQTVARYNNDWPEPQLQNTDGKTAGARIQEVLALFQPLPDRPTAVRRSKAEETRQSENRQTAQTTGS